MRLAKFEHYQDRRKQHRWRLRAPNGRIIADSAEGYTTKRRCLGGIESVIDSAWEAQSNIVEVKS
ncbi:DUF1508 domain-containing protein [Flagellatimonas centrodinii]|uniref:YegP family protein n=1 Tax=Flagellatimonas centrodinii TaxID=2806210 RepID=UPI001FF9988C|nr:DUF1508 domain-containing protein [Flagellatimonas centrodinii]ULQ45926.1 DUF1508 domain-containing protein [Flagellatimonas centrodinii]